LLLLLLLLLIAVENYVDTESERVLFSCQNIKTQMDNLMTDYHSYRKGHRQQSQCEYSHHNTVLTRHAESVFETPTLGLQNLGLRTLTPTLALRNQIHNLRAVGDSDELVGF